jgi:hypothetical protein
MNMFRVTKLIAIKDLGAFLQVLNASGDGFIVREMRVDADHLLLCVVCADRDSVRCVRYWEPPADVSIVS